MHFNLTNNTVKHSKGNLRTKRGAHQRATHNEACEAKHNVESEEQKEEGGLIGGRKKRDA